MREDNSPRHSRYGEQASENERLHGVSPFEGVIRMWLSALGGCRRRWQLPTERRQQPPDTAVSASMALAIRPGEHNVPTPTQKGDGVKGRCLFNSNLLEVALHRRHEAV